MDGGEPENRDSGGEGEGVVQTFRMDEFHPHEIYITRKNHFHGFWEDVFGHFS